MDGSHPLAGLGHNHPPAPSALEAFKAHIADTMAEARNHLDGEAVQAQGQADAIGMLLDQLRKAGKDADATRTAEKKPHLDACKAVDEAWRPVTESADLGVKACKAALAPFLAAKQAEADKAAAEARAEAERQRVAATEALRLAAADDLAAREAAEAMVKAAKASDAAAGRAEKVTAKATGGARAAALRTSWRADVTDLREAARHYWARDPEPFRAVVQRLADEDCRASKRQVPGVAFTQVKAVV